MKYKCIEPFHTIKQGDIVNVKIGLQVYITFNKATHCTNEFVLAINFEKVEVE